MMHVTHRECLSKTGIRVVPRNNKLRPFWDGVFFTRYYEPVGSQSVPIHV